MFKEYDIRGLYCLRNNKYLELLNYLFEECEILTFCELGSYCFENQAENFIKNIEKYRIKSIQLKQWYGWYNPFVICSGNADFDTYLIVHFYKCCEELKSILLEHTTDLLLGKYDPYYNEHTIDFSILQDICFFKKNKIFLATITHESMCSLYSQNNTDLTFFENIIKDTYCEIELANSEYSFINNYIDITKYGF
ncbi:MAG: hypothetical protein FWF57_00205 [Defluviitaleaceae bacterium]|nr:hypothetical protein [Defluviitaleaceae bacterium]